MILKIIGMILLSLLLLLLFVLAIVLFVSFRYNIKIDKDDDWSVDVRVSWLLRIFRARVTVIDGKQETVLKALWFNISPGKRRGRAEKRRETASDEEEKTGSEEQTETEKEEFFKTEPQEKTKKKYWNTKKKTDNRAREKKRSVFGILGGIKDKIDYVLNYPDRKKIQAYTIEFLADELRALKPKLFSISGTIGFDDPSTTGKFLGLISVVSALSGLRIMIRGNFEKPVIELCMRIKGKVSIWMLLFPLIKYIFKKPIWEIVKPKLFRKGEKNGNSVKQQS